MEIGWCWKEVFKIFLSNAVHFGSLETSAHLPGYKAVALNGLLLSVSSSDFIVLLVDWHSGSYLVSQSFNPAPGYR